MTIRFLVNFGLLALPIAITLGVLIGLNSSREASGGPPLFKPDPKPTAPKKKNGITTEQHCQKSYGIHPDTKGQEYTREYKPPNCCVTRDGIVSCVTIVPLLTVAQSILISGVGTKAMKEVYVYM